MRPGYLSGYPGREISPMIWSFYNGFCLDCRGSAMFYSPYFLAGTILGGV